MLLFWHYLSCRAYIYFRSPVSKDLVSHNKNDTSVPRIGALREMNLEYFPIDSQGFITDHERAREDLYGENSDNSRRFDTCLNVMASRVATVFASLKEALKGILQICSNITKSFELNHFSGGVERNSTRIHHRQYSFSGSDVNIIPLKSYLDA